MKIPVSPHGSRLSHPCVRIEAANECDGSICHEPIFNEEGGLNHVAPHYHLVEWDADIQQLTFYALFGDLLGTRTGKT